MKLKLAASVAVALVGIAIVVFALTRHSTEAPRPTGTTSPLYQLSFDDSPGAVDAVGAGIDESLRDPAGLRGLPDSAGLSAQSVDLLRLYRSGSFEEYLDYLRGAGGSVPDDPGVVQAYADQWEASRATLADAAFSAEGIVIRQTHRAGEAVDDAPLAVGRVAVSRASRHPRLGNPVSAKADVVQVAVPAQIRSLGGEVPAYVGLSFAYDPETRGWILVALSVDHDSDDGVILPPI